MQLIFADEAKLPAAACKPARAARGAKIAPASVKLETLKGEGVDLTERLKAGVKPEGIELASASAPAGQHPIRVTVRDSDGGQGSAEFGLTVK